MELVGHSANVTCVAFTNTLQNKILTASSDKSIRLWDIMTGRQLWKIKEFENAVTCMAVHPKDESFVAAGSKGNVILFDVLSGAVKGRSKCLSGDYGGPKMLSYAAKGTRILLAHGTNLWPGRAPGHVAVYSAANMKNLGIPLAFSLDRNVYEFSADGNSCLIWKHCPNLDTFRDLYTEQWEVWDISISKHDESDYFDATDPVTSAFVERVDMSFYEARKSGPVDYRPRDTVSYKLYHKTKSGKTLRRFFISNGVGFECFNPSISH